MVTLREIPEPLPVAPRQTPESEQFIAAHAENSRAPALRDVATQLREVAADSGIYTSVLERHRDAEQESLQAPARPVHVMEETRTHVLEAFERLEETYGRLNEAVKKASQDPRLLDEVSGIAQHLEVAQQRMTADRQSLDANSRAPEEELARAQRQAQTQAKKEAAQKREALRSRPIDLTRQASAWGAPEEWDVKRAASPAVEPDTRLSLGKRLIRTLEKFRSQQNLRPAAAEAPPPVPPPARALTFPETAAPPAPPPLGRRNQSEPNLVLQNPGPSSGVASTANTQRTPRKRTQSRPTPSHLKGQDAEVLREAAGIRSAKSLGKVALENAPPEVREAVRARAAELPPPVPPLPSQEQLQKLEAQRAARVAGGAHPRRADAPDGPQTTQRPSSPTHTIRR